MGVKQQHNSIKHMDNYRTVMQKDIIRGSNSAIFISVPLLSVGKLVKERICSCGANSFLKEKTPFGRISSSKIRLSKQEVTKLLSL